MFLDVFRVLSRIYCLQEKSLSSQKAMSFLGGLEGMPSQIPQIEPWFWNRFFFPSLRPWDPLRLLHSDEH